MTMNERVGDLKESMALELSREKLRELYKKAYVTRQRIDTQTQPKDPDQTKMGTQKRNIEFAQHRVSYWVSQGYEVLQIDECVFQSDNGIKTTWAPIAEPIHHASVSMKKAKHATVCAAISTNRGLRYAMVQDGAFDSKGFIRFVKRLLLRCNSTKVALFLDNASYHKSSETYDWLMQYHHKPNVRLHWCYNAVSRPDLNGIELYWRLCKEVYRRRVTENLVMGNDWNNYDLVVNLLQDIEVEKVQQCALKGWQSLFTAQLQPDWWNLQVVNLPMPAFSTEAVAAVADGNNIDVAHDVAGEIAVDVGAND